MTKTVVEVIQEELDAIPNLRDAHIPPAERIAIALGAADFLWRTSELNLIGTLRVVAGLIHDALPSAQGSAAEALAHAYEAIETTLHGVAIEPKAPIFECCNDACPWRGPRSETVHPKHEPDHLLCPECHEVVEQV